MDDADRAQAQEELFLERAIAAARGVPVTAPRWQHCHECGVELPVAHQHIPCKAAQASAALRRT